MHFDQLIKIEGEMFNAGLFEVTPAEKEHGAALSGCSSVYRIRSTLRSIDFEFRDHPRVEKRKEAERVILEFYDNIRKNSTRGWNTTSQALSVAVFAHSGQLRKDNETPYILHPIRVANRVIRFIDGMGPRFGAYDREVMFCAALLHDVIEDTDYDYSDIHVAIGEDKPATEIVDTVFWLTDIDNEQGSRKIRKHLSSVRLSRAPKHAQFVKLCDIYDNIHTANSLKDEFFKLFCKEKIETLNGIDNSLESDDGLHKVVFAVKQSIQDIYTDRTGYKL